MLLTTQKTLKLLAAIVWILGGAILMLKGYSLLKEANLIYYDMLIISSLLIFAFIVGQIQSKYIMENFCIKNLKRINGILEPKIYHFFEIRFFLFLTLMILTGVVLSMLASGNYLFLLAVGTLDLALSTALLKSSTLFFKSNQV